MRVVPRVVADEKNQFEVAHANRDDAVHIARSRKGIVVVVLEVLMRTTARQRDSFFALCTCLGRRVIPLPTQDCACHRIAFVDAAIPGQPGRSRSIVVTELASSKLLQIKVRNLVDVQPLAEAITTDADGFEVRAYSDLSTDVGCAC